MTRRIILALVIVAILLPLPSCRADTVTVVETDGFRIGLHQPQVDFPDSITFRVEAEGQADVAAITLCYTVDKLNAIPVTSIAPAEFEETRQARATWYWDMRKTGGLPPGTRLTYWWTMEDVEGNKAETTPAVVAFDDQRYSWRSLVSGEVSLYWYQGSDAFAGQLMDAAQAALARLADDIGAQPQTGTSIYIYAGFDDLRAAMIYPQEWTGGVAFTDYGTTAIGISPDNVSWGTGALAHELAHLVVHQFIFSGYGIALPTWLDEGLAMYAQGNLSREMRDALEYAVETHQLFTVRSLCSSFPADARGARLAYAQSYSLVEFLLQQWPEGEQKMLELLIAVRDGHGYVEALDIAYSLDMDELDRQWQEYVYSAEVAASLV